MELRLRNLDRRDLPPLEAGRQLHQFQVMQAGHDAAGIA
jgi:hypothetical protein